MGIGQTRNIDAKTVCPKGANQFQTQLSFPNWFMGWITSQGYSPRTAIISCK